MRVSEAQMPRRVVAGLFHHVPFWTLAPGSLSSMAARFPRWEFRETESEESLGRELPDAEVYFGWRLAEDLFRSALRLRWVHTPVVGIRRFLTPSFCDSSVLFTNGRGINAVPMAEHVMAVLLTRARGLLESARLSTERRWDGAEVEREAHGLRELEGSTILLVGYGTVGKEISRRALAFGMRVIAIRRHAPTDAAHSEPRAVASDDAVVVRSTDALLASLAEADYVACSLPYTPETENLFDEEAFRRMKSTVYFVNVGRGAVVVEAALIRALREGWIDGASLDVASREPLSPNDPLYDAPRLLLTPHVSGITPRYWERALAQFEENLRRYENGEPLRNLVDKTAGY